MPNIWNIQIADATVCRWLGIDYVFLMENIDDNNSTSQQLQLQHLYPDDFLTVHTTVDHPPQRRTYSHCIHQFRASFNWIAFIDLDEFLVQMDR